MKDFAKDYFECLHNLLQIRLIMIVQHWERQTKAETQHNTDAPRSDSRTKASYAEDTHRDQADKAINAMFEFPHDQDADMTIGSW